MYQKLKEKLWAYIVHNNPELMFNLQDEYKVTQYLEEKVSAVMPTAMKLLEAGKDGYAIHELCINEMTAELKPSRYHYIADIMSDEFRHDYERLRESGMLTYETVNLVEYCNETFDALKFNEQNIRDKVLREQIIGKICSYFLHSKAL